MPFDDKTVQEQKAWEYYKKLEDENYHLKRQLRNARDENRSLKKEKAAILKKYKPKNKKPKYRNNGKGGK